MKLIFTIWLLLCCGITAKEQVWQDRLVSWIEISLDSWEEFQLYASEQVVDWGFQHMDKEQLIKYHEIMEKHNHKIQQYINAK